VAYLQLDSTLASALLKASNKDVTRGPCPAAAEVTVTASAMAKNGRYETLLTRKKKTRENQALKGNQE
jgi:hypothetical protein